MQRYTTGRRERTAYRSGDGMQTDYLLNEINNNLKRLIKLETDGQKAEENRSEWIQILLWALVIAANVIVATLLFS